MQRLTGLDAGFLAMETPSSAMHVGGLAIYDPSATPGWTIESIRDVVRQRLHAAPPFRRRLVQVPFGLHHPVWIEDPDFDLDWHIRHIAVPAPGGPKELSELAAHLMSLPLDRSRPLWEMWVIEGLEHGHLATLTKIHHAAIDGASGAEITVALFDLTPEVAEVPPPAEPWKPDRVPSDAELLGYAVNSLSRTPFRAARAARNGVRDSELTAYPRSSASEGTRSGFQGSAGGGTSATSGVRSNRATVISAPEAPSMAAWWILVSVARCPCSRPSITHISHSGRLRSRGNDMRWAASSDSSFGPPGAGTAMWRMCQSRSKSGSSIHTG